MLIFIEFHVFDWIMLILCSHNFFMYRVVIDLVCCRFPQCLVNFLHYVFLIDFLNLLVQI